MNLIASLGRPEYVFHPAQILRRLAVEFRPATAEYETVRLPWGLPLRIQPEEAVGSAIRRAGIYELAACECISRLIDPGDLAVDAGANIGQMTSLMAVRAGARGKVICFEPHPLLFPDLQHNIAAWQQDSRVAPITARNVALSRTKGIANLHIPSGFEANHGVSFLEGSMAKDAEEGQYKVETETLDAAIATGQTIGFLKIDVEGHELQVLQGAGQLLESRRIRDILFEENSPLPTPVTEYLGQKGYTLFRIGEGFLGPQIAPISVAASRTVATAPNFIATRNPERALQRLSNRGWSVYRSA